MASHQPKRKLAQSELDDLVLLDTISEQRILNVLKNRYSSDSIYTSIGPVLIAINPYKTIPSLYTEAVIRTYRGKKYFEMPPHPYAVTDEAYSSLLSHHENQCVIISGESGSGKTETSKFIMQYISSVSGRGTEVQRVKDRMLSSNPILEGFGNAKTINNNNSSRFGKYMVLHFDYGGDPVGGHVSNYLLEKSRVVGPAYNERNFHVFYQLTLGASQAQRDELYIEEPSYYRYLNGSGCLSADGINDRHDWAEMTEAFRTVGITDEERVEIMRVLSIVLWLGNLSFTENAQEESSPTDMQVVDIIAHLMQISSQDVVEGLCVRTIIAGAGAAGERFKKPCSLKEAEFNRDTMAKALYSRLFDYVVAKINESIEPPQYEGNVIGVLDIFGFEIFEQNSFEQLCINFVNEKLQQIFIELTLKTEQEEYKAEGIPWTDVDYYNNKPVCDLIENMPGLLSLLDDTCSTNKTDHDYIRTMGEFFSRNECVSVGASDFLVRHYAGEVRYDSTSFVVKNKDTLFDDIILCIQKSPKGFVQYQGWAAVDVAARAKKRPPTVSRVFRDQVKALVGALMSCVPHYIRCIKPNHTKRSGSFDMPMIQRQVQYLGLLENVRVRRAGYAYRSTFDRFAKRYGVLSNDLIGVTGVDDRELVNRLCRYLNWHEGKEYAMGKTKIFIREAAVLFNIEEQLERKIAGAVMVIQAAYRHYLQKRKFMELKALGYDQMKKLNKERRRGSLSNPNMVGDNLNLRLCQPVQGLLVMNGAQKETIMFADRVHQVQVKERKGLFSRLFKGDDCVIESRILMVTNRAVYCFQLAYDPSANTSGNGAVAKLQFRVAFDQISSLALSPYVDGYMIFHFADSVGIKDALLNVRRKTEFLASLAYATEPLGLTVNTVATTSDKILVNAKKQTFALINWVKDEGVDLDSSRIIKIKQDFTINCPSGAPFSQTSEPYRPPKVDYVTGGRLALRALKDVQGNGVDELSFSAGTVLYAIRDEDKGWYQCEIGDQVGWVPAHTVERIGGSSANVAGGRPGAAGRPGPGGAAQQRAPGNMPPAFKPAPGGPPRPAAAAGPLHQGPPSRPVAGGPPARPAAAGGANPHAPPSFPRQASAAPATAGGNAGGVRAMSSMFGATAGGARPPGPPPAAPAGGSNWIAHQDPASGNTYYENKITGATQWDKPPGF